MITLINSSHIPDNQVRDGMLFVGLVPSLTMTIRIIHIPNLYDCERKTKADGTMGVYNGEYIIQLDQADDVSTLIHELRHVYQCYKAGGLLTFKELYAKNKKHYEDEARLAEKIYMAEYYNKGA